MHTFVAPTITAAFLAFAATVAIPETASAGPKQIRPHGFNTSAPFNNPDYRRNPRARDSFRRHCEPIIKYRYQHRPGHGWERVRVQIGYNCSRVRNR